MERPTLSQSWNRVDKLTPTLRSQVQIRRQLFRGEPWYVAHDPIGNNFFRLNPVAYYFIGLLDGRRTVDEAWNLTLDRFGDAAPTQNEVISLLGQLNGTNLLRVDLPPNAEPLLRRARERRRKLWGGQIMNILFVRFPLFNPEPMLKWLSPVFRPLLSKFGLVLWVAWIIFSLYVFLPHWDRFLASATSVLAPSNWGWMIVIFVVTKAIHEIGHGLMCKRFGGLVPEIGIMLLVLFPAPYVDATSSWSFSSRWHRVLVAAAGMMFELPVAGLAAVLWVSAADGSLLQQLTHNTVFIASVTTILFNGNPLIRFDGYYILSDLLDIPNMYDRSRKHLYYLVQRIAFGLTNVYPISTGPYESICMALYGVASAIYRVLLLFGIIMFIAGQLMIVGLVLAVWSMIAWGLVPLGKFFRWLAIDPVLYEHRARAIAVTTVFFVALILSVGVMPAEEHRKAPGVVESRQRSELAVQSSGFVTEIHAEEGEFVHAGDVLIVAENPELEAQRDALAAELAGLEARRSQTLVQDYVEYQMNEERIAAVREAIDDIDRRLADLVLRAPQDGTLIARGMPQLVGQYLQQGKVIGSVVRLDDLRVTAMVDQTENSDLATSIGRVEIRSTANLSKIYQVEAGSVISYQSGRTQLPHAALGYPGGGSIPVSRDDEHGMTALQPQFELWIPLRDATLMSDSGDTLANEASLKAPYVQEATGGIMPALPGQRVWVRITLTEKRPLVVQWIHDLRQIVRARLSV